MNSQEFIEYCKHQHDVVCNQKYDGNLPYSKHLDYVLAQAKKFKHLLKDDTTTDATYNLVIYGCAGHDLIEDARITYNDIINIIGTKHVGEFIADIIYCCTEEKGKNRDERHSDKYYKELSKNKLAIFVKLCDIIANVKYSILTNSSMLDKHRKEYVKMRSYLWVDEYTEMFIYLEKLLDVDLKVSEADLNDLIKKYKARISQ